jgi:hypothetical protein
MPEIALPAEESINWKGFWKGAIIGGIAGGIVGALAWVIGQLVRGAGPDTKSSRPNDGGSRLAVAGVAAATIAVTLNFGQHYDQLDPSKLPLLRNIFPPEPKVSTVRQFQPVYSQVFQFSLSIPQPFGLEHKEIAKLWTTILTHKEKDGAFMMAFATMPQPVQQAQPVSSGLPFSPVPTAYPPRVSFDVERALDSSAQTSVDFIQGIVTHKAPITQNGLYPGREVEGTLPSHDGVFRERIYIANGNFYQLVVVGIPAWTNSDDAKKFLDSFKIGP